VSLILTALLRVTCPYASGAHCAAREASQLPFAASRSLRVLLLLPLAISLPSELMATGHSAAVALQRGVAATGRRVPQLQGAVAAAADNVPAARANGNKPHSAAVALQRGVAAQLICRAVGNGSCRDCLWPHSLASHLSIAV
jgi:hypothetical protein